MAQKIAPSVELNQAICCGAITLIALALRLFGVSEYPFDGDEVFTILAARASWGDLLAIVVHDKSHPPLHYLAMKLWLEVGSESKTWARIPSVLFGTGLIPVTFFLCRELRLKTIDTAMVLLFVAMNGLLIYYAQHVRMFAIFEFFAALSLLIYIRFRNQPSWRMWTILTIVNTLMLYSHYWGAVVIATQVFLSLAGERKKAVMMLLSGVSAGCAFIPWIAAIAMSVFSQQNLTSQISWMGSGTPGAADYLWLMANFNGILNFDNSTRVGLALFVAPIVLFSLRLVRDRDYRTFFEQSSPGFWIFLIATPLLLTSLGSHLVKQNLWGERHLSMLAVPYYLLIGLSLTRLHPRLLSNLLRCMMFAWALASVATYIAMPNKKERWEIMTDAISAHSPAPIYASERFIQLPLTYHLDVLSGEPRSVIKEDNLRNIKDATFWYFFRDAMWDGVKPATQYSDLGYIVREEVSFPLGHQNVIGLLLEKKSR